MTTKFPNSITGAFTAVGEPGVAVCLRPGTEIAFDREAEWEEDSAHFRSENKRGARVARFRQINLDLPYAHHDAMEFPDGQIALVTHLHEGQYATVLQLPVSEHPAEEKPAAEAVAPAPQLPEPVRG